MHAGSVLSLVSLAASKDVNRWKISSATFMDGWRNMSMFGLFGEEQGISHFLEATICLRSPHINFANHHRYSPYCFVSTIYAYV